MNYDITKTTPPSLPKLGKGTEIIKILLSQVAKPMHEPLIPMLFPALGSHLHGAEFQYPDLSWKEICGQMATLVAESGMGKGQLSFLVDAICRSFRLHDEEELEKLVAWQKELKTRGANQEKPPRPDVAFWFPPCDMTNAAFLQNAIACEKLGAHTQFLNLPEVEMADHICGGHRQLSQMLRNIYDRQRTGALRATAEGIIGNPLLRVNLTLSATPLAARNFYKNELFNGTFGRMIISYKPRAERSGLIPRIGAFDKQFQHQLDMKLLLLATCKGGHVIHKLNRLVDRLALEMASLADLTDDDTLWDLSKRALLSAWKAGCILWVANGQKWEAAMGTLVEWLVYHDLWSKLQLFADLLSKDNDITLEARRSGPQNMLTQLPTTFQLTQLEALRKKLGKNPEGTKNQLHVWTHRGYITYDEQTQIYTKTPPKQTPKHKLTTQETPSKQP